MRTDTRIFKVDGDRQIHETLRNMNEILVHPREIKKTTDRKE